MSTKNFYANDAIYLRFELNYYTEIVVDLNKVPFLFGHWTSLVDGNKRGGYIQYFGWHFGACEEAKRADKGHH